MVGSALGEYEGGLPEEEGVKKREKAKWAI